MKTYHEFSNDFSKEDEPEQIDEGIIRSATSVVLVAQIRNLYKQIKLKKFMRNDDPDIQLDKLFTKIDLLSNQSIKLSYLIAQLAYMKDQK
jgi:hypothetical protein